MTWVTIRKHSETTGYTEDGIRGMIEKGIWLQGAVWRKVNGRILISQEGYCLWVEGRESELLERASRSTGAGRASAAERD